MPNCISKHLKAPPANCQSRKVCGSGAFRPHASLLIWTEGVLSFESLQEDKISSQRQLFKVKVCFWQGTRGARGNAIRKVWQALTRRWSTFPNQTTPTGIAILNVPLLLQKFPGILFGKSWYWVLVEIFPTPTLTSAHSPRSLMGGYLIAHWYHSPRSLIGQYVPYW